MVERQREAVQMSDAFRQTAALHTAQFEETVQAQRRQLQHASVMEADSSRLELRSMQHQFNKHSAQQRLQLIALDGMLSHEPAIWPSSRLHKFFARKASNTHGCSKVPNNIGRASGGKPRPLPTARTCTGQS